MPSISGRAISLALVPSASTSSSTSLAQQLPSPTLCSTPPRPSTSFKPAVYFPSTTFQTADCSREATTRPQRPPSRFSVDSTRLAQRTCPYWTPGMLRSSCRRPKTASSAASASRPSGKSTTWIAAGLSCSADRRHCPTAITPGLPSLRLGRSVSKITRM